MTGQKGNWIKVSKKTPHKPEMVRLAELTGVDLPTAFLAWFDFFAWLDGETEDGKLYGYTEFQLDGKAGLAGFTKAMMQIPWLFNLGDHWEVSNFTLYNGGRAKQNLQGAQRQRRRRNCANDAVDKTDTFEV